jgi:hypothetical protein
MLPTIWKDKISEIFKVNNHMSFARNRTLELFKEGSISLEDANTILAGLSSVTVNIKNLAIDNSIKDNTTWGNIIGGLNNNNNSTLDADLSHH